MQHSHYSLTTLLRLEDATLSIRGMPNMEYDSSIPGTKRIFNTSEESHLLVPRPRAFIDLRGAARALDDRGLYNVG